MSDSQPASTKTSDAAPKRHLTLFDSTCIIVGIIIGAGIYESTPLIASQMPSLGWLLGIWLFGGLLSLIGALCYAELATAYPKEGGDYVYLTRAFGRSCGFLFAWAQLWVIRPGSIGAMAYIFGRYANQLVPLEKWTSESIALMVYAALSILVLTGINILGVKEGKWTQNVLTVVKVLGMVGIVAVGLSYSPADVATETAAELEAVAEAATPTGPLVFTSVGEFWTSLNDFLPQFGLAMIFVLFTYGGWNEMAYVGAEVRNPEKSILRALLLGTVAVTAIYMLVTWAFVHSLGYQQTCSSNAVAADVLALGLGDWAGRTISILICISALGAINGQIFTGARIYYAMGTEHRLYARLGQWSQRAGTPVWSLVIQAAITLALVVGFGVLEMRGHSQGGFASMVIFTTPVFWFFLLLVGISVAELRFREPDTRRPYVITGYPITPILFCLSSLFMLYSSLVYAVKNQSVEALWSVAILVVGLALVFCESKPERGEESSQGDG